MYWFRKKVKHFLSNCQKIISNYMQNHMEDTILSHFLLTKRVFLLKKQFGAQTRSAMLSKNCVYAKFPFSNSLQHKELQVDQNRKRVFSTAAAIRFAQQIATSSPQAIVSNDCKKMCKPRRVRLRRTPCCVQRTQTRSAMQFAHYTSPARFAQQIATRSPQASVSNGCTKCAN